MVGVVEQRHDNDGRRDAGDQGADTGAGGPHAEAEDQHRIDCDVDYIHNQGAEHGHLAVAHGPEQGGPRVVNAHEGIGRGGEQEIDQGVLHHVGLHAAEDQRQNVLPEDQRGPHQQQGQGAHGVQKLLGGSLGVVGVLPPQILGNHHRPAGGEGGKDLNDECIDVVHQRDAGYGGLAGGGDHDGIRHADSHQQKLLNDQGNDEPQQCVAGKEQAAAGRCLFRHSPASFT